MSVEPLTPEAVVKLALQSGLEVYLNLLGIPTALLPKNGPDEPVDRVPVHSAPTQEWLSLLYYEKRGRIPSGQTLREAATTLAGMAREAGHHATDDKEADELISRDPVAIVLFRRLRGGPITGFGATLYDELTDLAMLAWGKNRKWPGKACKWPGAAHIFGRRVQKLKPLAARKGVLITWEHTYEGTLYDIRYANQNDVTTEVTAAVASGHNIFGSNILSPPDATDTILVERLQSILASAGPQQRLSAEQIKLWVPRKEEEICGLAHLKEFFRHAYSNNGRTQNILITGDMRSGKTSTVKWYVTCLACAQRGRPTMDPCGECGACREAVARFGQFGWDSDHKLSELDFVPIDCPNCSGLELKEKLTHLYDSNKLAIVYLDEFHRFEERGKDERLLKAIEERQIVWIASCIKPRGLDPAVLERFGERLRTESPTKEEAALWAASRCHEWDIQVDDPTTLVRLAVRASHVPGKIIKVIASAATRGRILTRRLLEDYKFQAGD